MRPRVSPFTTLWDFRQFQSGWWAGWAFLPVVAFAGWVIVTTGRKPRAPWGLVGPAWVLGSLLALDGWLHFDQIVVLPDQLLWGLLAAAAGNELASHTPNPKILGCGLVLLGRLCLPGQLGVLASPPQSHPQQQGHEPPRDQRVDDDEDSE